MGGGGGVLGANLRVIRRQHRVTRCKAASCHDRSLNLQFGHQINHPAGDVAAFHSAELRGWIVLQVFNYVFEGIELKVLWCAFHNERRSKHSREKAEQKHSSNHPRYGNQATRKRVGYDVAVANLSAGRLASRVRCVYWQLSEAE